MLRAWNLEVRSEPERPLKVRLDSTESIGFFKVQWGFQFQPSHASQAARLCWSVCDQFDLRPLTLSVPVCLLGRFES